MRQITFVLFVVVALITVELRMAAQNAPASAPQPARTTRPQEPPHSRRAEVGWRLAPSEQQYASIDGRRLTQYVDEITAMSRRYRDNGHPQFWGRIIGTEADAENARWMMDKFRQIGLADVREQRFDLPPQWMPQSWSVVASGGGLGARGAKSLKIDTAQPTYLSEGTTAAGLDLEAVWTGFASEADLGMSREVRGKAAFFYSTDTSSRHIGVMDGAIKRLADRGAAAIFVVQGIPGNLRTQFYPVNSPVPTFSVGLRDGLAMRDLIGLAGSTAPRVKIQLDVQMVANLHSATVWGTLPGATDENIVVVAHRDGWFEGANDNASGMATMIVLAEYFAKIPRAERRRSIVFLGTTGHHNNGGQSGAWLGEHPEVFAKTAVLLNSEHTGAVMTGQASTRQANAAAVSTWFAGGDRLADIVVKALDAFGVPTYAESSPTPAGEIGRYFQFAPSVQFMTSGFVWHSDQETSDTISATAIAAITRAYAKVMADSNAVPLSELRRPASQPTTRQ
jgi:hypothetical protein